jgi:hypothetical protein
VRTLLTLSVAVLLAGCSGSDKPAARTQSTDIDEVPVSTADADAAALGREIYDLVDRAMSYRSAHRGHPPRSLRELGIDELTSSTSRVLTVSENMPTVTVAFRSIAGRTVASCWGTNTVLEEAALSGGEFSVICTLVSGGSTTLKAQR